MIFAFLLACARRDEARVVCVDEQNLPAYTGTCPASQIRIMDRGSRVLYRCLHTNITISAARCTAGPLPEISHADAP